MMLKPLGEVGANFSPQLSSQTLLTKINNKKVIAENQCEKHKKSSLAHFPPVMTFFCLLSLLLIFLGSLFCKQYGPSSKCFLPWADPEGGTGGLPPPPPPPLKNHKIIGFLSNTGMNPLENHKGTKLAVNVGPLPMVARL